MAQIWSHLGSRSIPQPQLHGSLSVGGGPPGSHGHLPRQIFSEFYIIYLRLYYNFLKIDQLSCLQHYLEPNWNPGKDFWNNMT